MTWYRGSTFGEKLAFISHSIAEYNNGQYWIVAGLSRDGHLYYFTRHWKNGITVESEPHLISDEVISVGGSSNLFISEKDGFLQFSIATMDGIKCWWIRPEELELPLNNNKKKVLIGNSLREILHAEADLFPRKLMTLQEHEQAIIDNKINFERIDAIYLLDFMRAHCIRMSKHGVTILLTLGDKSRLNIGSYREIVAATHDIPNIIYDVENEFNDEGEWVDVAGRRAEYIIDFGLQAAGGGFGNSTFGEANDRLFEKKYPMCQYKKIHRPYPPLKVLLDFVEKQKELGKKIICDELLWDHSVPCMENPEQYIRSLVDAGVYGMNIYDGQFELAGRLCREYNG